jgi:hypothetical protein
MKNNLSLPTILGKKTGEVQGTCKTIPQRTQQGKKGEEKVTNRDRQMERGAVPTFRISKIPRLLYL